MRITIKATLITGFFMMLVTAIGLLGVYIGFNLQKPYLQPIGPTLRFFPTNEKIVFNDWELIKPHDTAIIRFCVENMGLTTAKQVNFNLIEDYNNISSSSIGFGDIPSLELSCTDLAIRESHCHGLGNGKFEKNCEEASLRLPNGTVNLIFRYTCLNCIERESNITIPVCITKGNRFNICP